jgi:hypothetical protein
VGSGGAGEGAVAAVGGVEADAALVELLAQVGEAVLGEVAGLQFERGGEQLERAAAGPLVTAGEEPIRDPVKRPRREPAKREEQMTDPTEIPVTKPLNSR